MKARSPQSTASNDVIFTKTSQQVGANGNPQSEFLPWEGTQGPKSSSSQSAPATSSQFVFSKAPPPHQPKKQNEDVTIPTEASVLMLPALQETASPETSLPFPPFTTPAAGGFSEDELGFAPMPLTVMSDDSFEQKFMELRMKVEDKLSCMTSDILNRMADKTKVMCESTEILAQLDTNLRRILSYEGFLTATSGGRASGGTAASQGRVSSRRRSASRISHQSSSSPGIGSPDVQGMHRGTHLERLCHACAPSSRTAPPVMRV